MKIRQERQGGFWKSIPKSCKKWGILAGLGLCYFLLIKLTPIRIPCVFHKLTGFACPGCGISTLCVRLLHLDFKGAVQENLAASLILPVWAVVWIIRGLFHPQALRKGGKVENILAWSCVILLIVFGVLRNLPGMEWLLPSYMRS